MNAGIPPTGEPRKDLARCLSRNPTAPRSQRSGGTPFRTDGLGPWPVTAKLGVRHWCSSTRPERRARGRCAQNIPSPATVWLRWPTGTPAGGETPVASGVSPWAPRSETQFSPRRAATPPAPTGGDRRTAALRGLRGAQRSHSTGSRPWLRGYRPLRGLLAGPIGVSAQPS